MYSGIDVSFMLLSVEAEFKERACVGEALNDAIHEALQKQLHSMSLKIIYHFEKFNAHIHTTVLTV